MVQVRARGVRAIVGEPALALELHVEQLTHVVPRNGLPVALTLTTAVITKIHYGSDTLLPFSS